MLSQTFVRQLRFLARDAGVLLLRTHLERTRLRGFVLSSFCYRGGRYRGFKVLRFLARHQVLTLGQLTQRLVFEVRRGLLPGPAVRLCFGRPGFLFMFRAAGVKFELRMVALHVLLKVHQNVAADDFASLNEVFTEAGKERKGKFSSGRVLVEVISERLFQLEVHCRQKHLHDFVEGASLLDLVEVVGKSWRERRGRLAVVTGSHF